MTLKPVMKLCLTAEAVFVFLALKTFTTCK